MDKRMNMQWIILENLLTFSYFPRQTQVASNASVRHTQRTWKNCSPKKSLGSFSMIWPIRYQRSGPSFHGSPISLLQQWMTCERSSAIKLCRNHPDHPLHRDSSSSSPDKARNGLAWGWSFSRSPSSEIVLSAQTHFYLISVVPGL